MAIFNTVYGGDGKRHPGSNTIAYYPLEKDVKDYSGNGNDGTLTGTPTYVQDVNVDVANFGSGCMASLPTRASGISTYMLWTKLVTGATWQAFFDYCNTQGSMNSGIILRLSQDGSSTSKAYIGTAGSSQGTQTAYSPSISLSNWHHFAIVNSGSGTNMSSVYVDGQLGGTINWETGVASGGLYLHGERGSAGSGAIRMSKFIIENKARTAQEIADYYNQTKANYGL